MLPRPGNSLEFWEAIKITRSISPHPEFEQVLFGASTRMTSFGVLRGNTLYTCAHQWNKTAAYFFRRLQSPPKNAYGIVTEREQVAGMDLVISKLDKSECNAPILQPIDIELRVQHLRTPAKPLPLLCLFDGQEYLCTEQWITQNNTLMGRISIRTYPGLSGVGFVDSKNKLYLLNAGSQSSAMSLITPVAH